MKDDLHSEIDIREHGGKQTQTMAFHPTPMLTTPDPSAIDLATPDPFQTTYVTPSNEQSEKSYYQQLPVSEDRQPKMNETFQNYKQIMEG